MSTSRHLVSILFLAACDRAQPPVAAEPAPPPAPPRTEPAAERTVAPAPPPPTAPAIAPAPTAAPVPKRPCHPMSRAGCRWREDRDEREQSRVVHRAPETSR